MPEKKKVQGPKEIKRKAPPGSKWIQLESDDEALAMQTDSKGKLLPAGESKLLGYDPETKQARVRI